MTEQALVTQILDGSKSAFATFVSRYEALVAHVINRLIPNEADREDIRQDVFVKAYRNLSGFEFNSKLSTWVARIARNTALNHLEKKRAVLYDDITAEEDTIENQPVIHRGPDELAVEQDISARIRAEIDNLPVMYGVVLALYHLEEMSYKDMADILQLPEGTVKSYLFRGRKMLRERLSDRYPEEDLCH